MQPLESSCSPAAIAVVLLSLTANHGEPQTVMRDGYMPFHRIIEAYWSQCRQSKNRLDRQSWRDAL